MEILPAFPAGLLLARVVCALGTNTACARLLSGPLRRKRRDRKVRFGSFPSPSGLTDCLRVPYEKPEAHG